MRLFPARRLLILGVPLVTILALALLKGGSGPTRESPLAQPSTPPAALQAGPAAAESQMASPPGGQEERDASAPLPEAFRQAGFREVQAEEPDPRVQALDPSLEAEAPGLLVLQLRTAMLGDDQLPAIRQILIQAKDEAVREAALEVAERMSGKKADALRMDLIRRLEITAERERLISALHPSSRRDAVARFLAEKAESLRESESFRELAATQLAVLALRDGLAAGALARGEGARRVAAAMKVLTLPPGSRSPHAPHGDHP